MKYIKEEIIITTDCNKDIEDIDVIKQLIKSISELKIYASLSYQTSIQYEQRISSYPQVKIIKINDDTIDIRIFGNKANAVIKNISYTDITNIKIISAKNELLIFKDNIGHFDLLDIG